MLIFLVGTLLGVILGGTLCVHYLRQAITADIGPKLKNIQFQLDHIEAEQNLASATRYAEMSARLPAENPTRHLEP
ncbi:MAG TPA: hypothetical protein VGH27_16970 [Streptosporangiaceae bacterium]|jgi:hypothetical protein